MNSNKNIVESLNSFIKHQIINNIDIERSRNFPYILLSLSFEFTH